MMLPIPFCAPGIIDVKGRMELTYSRRKDWVVAN